MSLGEHLVDLRRRLFISAAGVLIGAVAGYFASDFVWAALSAPLETVAQSNHRLAEINYTSISEAFDTKMSISIWVGVIASSPIWLWQLWAYVTPALVRREKLITIGFLAAAIPLFLAGCAVGWWLFPNVVSVMTAFAPEGTTTLLTARYYLDFSVKFIIAIGAGFVMPVFLVLLNFAGVLSAKAILTGWHWAVVLITVFTGIVTPGADAFSMILLAIPIIALYFLAALIAVITDRRRAKRLAAEGLS